MPLHEIFSHSDRYHYRANIFSLATCFLILCATLTFLPPFLFTYFAGGFWLKEASYSEQPRINFSSQYILMVENSGGTTTRLFSSSFASLNTAFRNVLFIGTDTFSAIDNNNDGITDQFAITFQILFDDSTPVISNINVWLIFQYELRARQYIKMETLALVNLLSSGTIILANSPIVSTEGDLILQQRQPIQSSGSDTTYNQSIIDLDSLLSTSSINLNPVLDEYFTRNYYTTYQPQYLKWETGAVRATPMLTVNIIVNVGRQTIRFVPGFWQEFKWGWIQYACFLLPFIAVFNRIKEFVFRNRIVRTLVEIPFRRYKA